MSTDSLAAWGMTARFEVLAAEYEGMIPARVVWQEKDCYGVTDSSGERSAVVSGKFRFEAQTVSDFPAVGDFVMLDPVKSDERAVIRAVLPRRSVFVRRAAGTTVCEQVVAANVDIVFICMSLNNDFNLRRLERYLAIAWESGATPVVVLTKADLCPEASVRRAEAETVAAGADVLVTSALESDGYEAVLPYIAAGRTVAFTGSSGVGKSTLINRLLGEDRLETNGLRGDDRGRHTTTRRSLCLIPDGGVVIDTPGMRELGMWDAAEGLETAFADVEELAARCRFSDCTHTDEPGCAVTAAMDAGELARERLESYRKLKSENERVQRGESYLAAKERKFRTIAKLNKHNKKK